MEFSYNIKRKAIMEGENKMSNDIKIAALTSSITLVVAIISLIVSSICNHKILNHSKHESRRMGITSQRMQWITEVRNIFGELLVYDYRELIEDKSELKRFKKTVQMIKLYLNFQGKIDNMILDSLDQMQEIILSSAGTYILDTDFEKTFERTMAEVQKCGRVYLKSEWTRVKHETNPKFQGLEYNENDEIDKLIVAYVEHEHFIDERPQRDAAAVREMLGN